MRTIPFLTTLFLVQPAFGSTVEPWQLVQTFDLIGSPQPLYQDLLGTVTQNYLDFAGTAGHSPALLAMHLGFLGVCVAWVARATPRPGRSGHSIRRYASRVARAVSRMR